MLSVGTIRFEDRFCTSRKGETGGGGWVHRSGWPCMVAAAAGYRIGQRWMACSSAFLYKRVYKTICSPCRDSVSGLLGSFQSGGAFSGRKVLTNECSVMSGCGHSYEPTKNFWRKLWIKVLELTPGRSGNTGERRWDLSKQNFILFSIKRVN